MSFTPEEGEEDAVPTLEELGAEGPALVVRSGGGRGVSTSSRRASARPSAARRTATSSSTM